MRRVAFVVVAVVLGLLLVLGPLWTVGRAAPAQQGKTSSCSMVDSKTGKPLSSRVIIPSSIRLCDTAEVSMTVRASCSAIPLHVVINLDRSGSMTGQAIDDVKNAATILVQTLDLQNHPDTMVGLVSHGDPATVDSQLTNNAGQIIGRIRKFQAGGEDNVADAIGKAKLMLMRARSGTKIPPYDVMVVLTDGGQTYPTSLGIAAANSAKGAGILMVTVCAEDASSFCPDVRRMASSSRYYFEARGTSGLTRIFRQIATELLDIGVRDLSVEETVPDDLDVVPDSIFPTPSSITGRTLRWDFRFAAQSGESISYLVQPHKIITYPLAISTVTFTDNQNGKGSGIMPTAVLTVTSDCPQEITETPTPTATDTPTGVPPTPTSTPTPTNTPTATPTATVTPTPTPRPSTRYLPILNLSKCIEYDRPVDAVLIIDASMTMGDSDGGMQTKLQAAQAGAKAFVDLMRPVDQTAVLAFNLESHWMTGLTADRATLHAAIDGITLASWTRIDLALDAAAAELAGPHRRPESIGAIVLLTDGLPTKTTPEAVLAAADRARAAGNRIFTIGIGPDVDEDLLIAIAGDSGRYFPADKAEALIDIYKQISEKMGCP
jgi:Mg-chelatase subunit ChlD